MLPTVSVWIKQYANNVSSAIQKTLTCNEHLPSHSNYR